MLDEFASVPVSPDADDQLTLSRYLASLEWYGGVVAGGSTIAAGVHGGNSTYFQHEPRPKMMFGLGMTREHQLTEPQTTFVHGHEMGHFIQFLQDPQNYKRVFATIEEKSHGDKKLQAAWKRFFNIYLDVHSNATIIHRSTVFQPTERLGQVPRDLYHKFFAKTDFTSIDSHASQFVDYCLRRMMLPDEEITVTPEVRQALDEPITLLGETYEGVEDFVRRNIYVPNQPLDVVMFALQYAIMPRFEKLLKEDEKQGRLDKLEQQMQGEGIDKGLDPSDPGSFEGADKYIDETRKSATQRSKENQRKKFEEEMKAKGQHSDREIREMWERRERTEKTVDNVRDLWWRLVQRSREYGVEKVAGFTRGTSPNLASMRTQLPVLKVEPSKAAVFERSVMVPQEEQIHPRKIDIFLSVDASGSMFTPTSKMEAAIDAAYAIPESLFRFQEEGEMNSPGFPIEVNAHLIAFGGAAVEIFDLKAGPGQSAVAARQELWEKIVELNKDRGGTDNSASLEIVLDKIKAQTAEDPTEDVRRILLNITDGNTERLQEAKALLEEIRTLQTTCKGIKIEDIWGMPSTDEHPKPGEEPKPPPPPEPEGQIEDLFKKLWGDDGVPLRDINKLRDVLEHLLAEILTQED